MSKLIRVALTPGEPAGIGPDLVIQLAQQNLPAEIVVIADPNLLQERAKQLQLPLRITLYEATRPVAEHVAGHLIVLPMLLATNVRCGIPNVENVTYVLATLRRAALGCLHQEFAALVTGPVHKGIINDAGVPFSGHTEFLATLTQTSHVVMLMLAKQLRVALVTTHIPLNAVAASLSVDLLTQTLLILQQELQQRFGIAKPRIAVCGLNPHAGEGGHLGREEIDIIIPALNQLRQAGMHLIGPVPADTAFLPQHLAQADVILTMYHDQGLPVLKHLGFDEAVNLTLGLPFVRTSVDHGTALELAGTGKAKASSLFAALETAVALGAM